MLLPHQDAIFTLAGATPDYTRDNPLSRLTNIVARCDLAAGRESYLLDHMQYLVPFNRLELYEGAEGSGVHDPAHQDNKEDFQKQNLRRFDVADTMLARGWAIAGQTVVPFLRFEYSGAADSVLSQASRLRLGSGIGLWVKIGNAAAATPLRVPLNPRSGKYEIELWGYQGADLASVLSADGGMAVRDGFIVPRPDLVKGQPVAFARENASASPIIQISPDAAMHPVLPLQIQLAWADERGAVWDSQQGRDYRYEFGMIVRGMDHYLEIGRSANPHGGIGRLEYRNLMSNYFSHRSRNELGRTPAPWSFDAFGSKSHGGRAEPFMAVDYMDLHVLMGDSGIGLHRHRDNSEVFLVTRGRGFMVIGDWCTLPHRERAFEVRTLREGHFAALKGGQLHALMNATDEPMQLFMFGGYD